MKHGRENLPWRMVNKKGPRYEVTCDCGTTDDIAAPRWLPDDVIAKKFIERGWTGYGHLQVGVPRYLTCAECNDGSRAVTVSSQRAVLQPTPEPLTIERAEEIQTMARGPLPSPLRQQVNNIFNRGHHTSAEVLDVLKREHPVMYQNTAGSQRVSAMVSQLRRLKGLPPVVPRKKRVERMRPSEVPKGEAPKAPGSLLEEGPKLAHDLVAWVKLMRESGFEVGLTVIEDERGHLEKLKMILSADIE